MIEKNNWLSVSWKVPAVVSIAGIENVIQIDQSLGLTRSDKIVGTLPQNIHEFLF